MCKLYFLCGWLMLGFFVRLEAKDASTTGGGWTKERGRFFVKLGQSYLQTGDYFSPDGDVIDITTVGVYTSSLYAEVGILDGLEAIAYVPFLVISTLNNQEFRSGASTIEGEALNAIGDINIGVKYGILRNTKIVLAVSLILGLPTGEAGGKDRLNGRALFGGKSETGLLQTGDGEFNQLLMLEASTSFHPLPLYASVGLGFNNRTKNFAEEIRYTAEVGGHVGRLHGALKLMGLNYVGTFEGKEPDPRAGNGVFSNKTEYLAVGPELAFSITEHIGVSASAAFALSGKNILAAPSFGGGIYASW